MSNHILEQLNEEQQQAVQHTDGPVMIIAGAGTGKTKVITNRIAYIIDQGLAKPEEILALTFTEKASQEMKNRLDIVLPYGQSDVDVYTFHSFGDALLKENAITLGITPDYKLLNRAEEVYFFREHLFAFSLDYYRPLSNPTRFIEILLSYFSKLKDEDISEGNYQEYTAKLREMLKAGDNGEFENRELLEEHTKIHAELASVYIEYEKLKKEEGVITFADLISLSLYLLRTSQTIRTYYQHKYKYVLVDEYQDTNYTQNEIVKILAEKHTNLCVCGDDDQSIYKFRGASISNILKFQEYFPACFKIVLTKNYRSTQEILDRAYQLITYNNPDRLEIAAKINKKLIAQNSDKHFPVIAKELDTIDDELSFLTQTIKDIQEEDKSLNLSDVAILIRSNNQAQQIIRECNLAGVPFKYQGNTGLYETKEIRPLLSFLFALARFDDNINYFNLALSSIYTLSMTSLIACNNLARINNKPLSTIFSTIETYQEQLHCSEEEITSIKAMMEDIEHYRELSREENVGSVLLNFIKDKGYLEAFSNGQNTVAVENIQRFFQRIDRFIANTNATSIPEFCNYVDYTREMGDDPAADEVDPSFDGVNILTIHKAKGMEFRVVFMIDLVDGRFPTRHMKDPIDIPEPLVKEILPEGNFHKQEERRLFYVGMTRAKEQLFLLSAKDYYQKTLKTPSPFVMEAMGLPQTKGKRQKAPIKETTTFKEDSIIFTDTEKNISLSQSQIEDYLTCPRKYEYVHTVGLQTTRNFNTFYGSLMHMITQEMLKRDLLKQPMTEEEALAMLEAEWREDGYLSEEHTQAAYTLAQKTIKDFLVEKKHIHAKYIEKPFKVTYDSTTRVEGRWDIVEKDGRIIDLKTSIVTNEKEAITKAKDSTQLKIYAWAYEKTFHELPIAVELLFLGNNIRGGYVPTGKTLKEAEKVIAQVSAGIKAGDFAANPSFLACSFCQFNKICEFTLAG